MIDFVPKSRNTPVDLFDFINLSLPHTQVPKDSQTSYTCYLTTAQLSYNLLIFFNYYS